MPAPRRCSHYPRAALDCTAVSDGALYLDTRTGKMVRQVGGGGNSEEFVMVMGEDRSPYHVQLAKLVPCDERGTPNYDMVHVKPEEADEKPPEPVVGIIDTRLNINTATAEEIHKRVPGIGYRTAKKIKEIQLSLPGEVYRTLDQVKAASTRLNWDSIFRQNLLFIG